MIVVLVPFFCPYPFYMLLALPRVLPNRSRLRSFSRCSHQYEMVPSPPVVVYLYKNPHELRKVQILREDFQVKGLFFFRREFSTSHDKVHRSVGHGSAHYLVNKSLYFSLSARKEFFSVDATGLSVKTQESL